MLIDVLVLTYNHEKYLAMALDSVLSQKGDFDLRIVVGEDCSTDGTRKVLEYYTQKHPDVIVPVYREKNMGLKPNFVDLFFKCNKGKYVAILSGDDYWIDDYKLQKQIDFLEKNPEYSFVCTNGLYWHENTRKFQLVHQVDRSFVADTKDIMIHNPCIASSVMFRNGLIKEFPPPFWVSRVEDVPFYIFLSLFGYCKYFVDITVVYRKHGESITGQWRDFKDKVITLRDKVLIAEAWSDWLGGKYESEVEVLRKRVARRIVFYSLKRKRFLTVIKLGKYLDYKSYDTFRGRVIGSLFYVLSNLFYRRVRLDNFV